MTPRLATLRLAILLPAALLPAAAFAQTNTFDLVSGGKVVGHSTFTIAKAKQGFRLTGKFSYSNHGADAHISDDLRLTDTYAFQQGSLTDDNSQTVYSYTPDKARTALTIGAVQAGQMESHKLVIKPDLAFLPGYDAGSAQVLLLLAVTHPSGGNAYSVLIPGVGAAARIPSPDAAGGEAPAGPRPGNNAYDTIWTKGADATGTFEDKPVTLHTYTLAGGKATWTFYADDQNTLMQLDASMVGTSYIRARFKLDAAK
jgi:hypothetical protein